MEWLSLLFRIKRNTLFDRWAIGKFLVDGHVSLHTWAFFLAVYYNFFYDYYDVNILCFCFTIYTKESFWYRLDEEEDYAPPVEDFSV